MSNLGLGVMISMLGGNRDSADAYNAALGKVIAAATLTDDALTLQFTDGSGVKFYDDGQSCCESRYFRTDDDLARIVGATLVSAEIRDAKPLPHEWGEHEIQFLDVQTSAGLVQVCAHNEHNGYYGGFSLRVAAITSTESPNV